MNCEIKSERKEEIKNEMKWNDKREKLTNIRN